MGDLLGGDPGFGEPLQNESALGDHAGICHDNGVIIPNEGDGPGDVSCAICRHARHKLPACDGFDIPLNEHGDSSHGPLLRCLGTVRSGYAAET
jgi:hypothetical protein